MTLVAQIMLWIFIAAWCVGAAGHIYASRYFISRWLAGFKRRADHEGYGQKILIGYGVFLAAVAVGFAAGGIAELAGGWS